MKILFTTKGTTMGSAMDPRFGRTEYFVIYDDKTKEIESYDNRAIEHEAHGAGTKTAQKLIEFGVSVLITGNGPGGNAAAVLQAAGTEVYAGAGDMTADQALKAFLEGKLQKI